MKKDLTQGSVTKNMLLFAAPMILGNLLQQFYNIADTLIVGQFLGPGALAAVGSAYTLMTFLTSILIGMCMGSGALFSYYFGKKEEKKMRDSMQLSFLLTGGVTILLNLLVMVLRRPILRILQIPEELMEMMHTYVWIIFLGIFFVFLYNYFAYLLRAVGNSVVPLYFLGSTAVLNVVLDLIFVMVCRWGIAGAAGATVIAQAVSGLGLMAYTWLKEPQLRFNLRSFTPEKGSAAEILRFSFSSSIQQSVMNFGILMIQGLVNSFGAEVMAAFAAAVKIDSFAYMPAQEFGNAFSLFISQNYGAGLKKRVWEGMRSAVRVSMLFCISVSVLVFLFAPYLMLLFISPEEAAIIAIGAGYLRIEGAFYCGIGILFLLYGYYRGINRPEMSLVLTVISLGDQGCAGLCTGARSSNRSDRYLECHSHRMGSCGCNGDFVYAAAGRRCCKLITILLLHNPYFFRIPSIACPISFVSPAAICLLEISRSFNISSSLNFRNGQSVSSVDNKSGIKQSGTKI